jgi:hypothetical protein
MICPKCKTEQSDTAQFCPQCATPLKAVPSKVNPVNRWAGIITLVALILAIPLVVILAMNAQRNSRRVERQKQMLQQAAGLPPQVVQNTFPTSHVLPITNGAATVRAAAYSWYTFVVPTGASTVAVVGHFSATGGSGNDIECYILDEDGLTNIKNGHAAKAYFNSGKVTQAKIGAVLPLPGTYYLVLDNRFSLLTPKAVQIDAVLSYTQ